jgi:predicted ATPase
MGNDLMPNAQLSSLTLRGFKSIKDLTDFPLEPVNLLIGANGAGKSNLLSFFRMLSYGLNTPGELQSFIGQAGGANALLHDGAHTTREIEAGLTLMTGQGMNDYAFRLSWAAGDTLIFVDERFRFSKSALGDHGRWHSLDAGHKEARLPEQAVRHTTAQAIYRELRRFRQFQFHNTSDTARVRTKWHVEDGRHLKEDGANLAPFLYRLAQHHPAHYLLITDTIRQVAPFFADFEFVSGYDRILLSWRERDCDLVFNASQAADGLLRFMILAALLLQPAADLPSLILLDEPELGLHPFAIDLLGELIQSASAHTQFIVATQSATLLDNFSPEQTVVVTRDGRASGLRRLQSDELDEWLQEYTLSELWRKNVVGGRP